VKGPGSPPCQEKKGPFTMEEGEYVADGGGSTGKSPSSHWGQREVSRGEVSSSRTPSTLDNQGTRFVLLVCWGGGGERIKGGGKHSRELSQYGACLLSRVRDLHAARGRRKVREDERGLARLRSRLKGGRGQLFGRISSAHRVDDASRKVARSELGTERREGSTEERKVPAKERKKFPDMATRLPRKHL